MNTWQETAEGEDGRPFVKYTYEPEDFIELPDFKANYVNLSFPGIYSVKPKGDNYALEPKVSETLTRLIPYAPRQKNSALE